uniref:Uncharacterized protein n=1 Tax=Zea mays TaxID=4577 RepID=C0PNN1_MAIZE|nr:unknown [Zea mays]
MDNHRTPRKSTTLGSSSATCQGCTPSISNLSIEVPMRIALSNERLTKRIITNKMLNIICSG